MPPQVSQDSVSMFSRKRGRSMSRGSRSSRSSRSSSRRSSVSTISKYNRAKMGGWGLQTDASYLQIFDPFPAKMVCRLRYYDQISLDPSTGVTIHHLFRANGINDPDQSGVGHQPYGHDTYASIYNHNRVLRSTIVVKCISAGSDGVWGISRTDDATVSSDMSTNVEQKGTVFDHIHAKYNGTTPSDRDWETRL